MRSRRGNQVAGWVLLPPAVWVCVSEISSFVGLYGYGLSSPSFFVVSMLGLWQWLCGF